MLPFCKVKGHVKVMGDLLVSLSFTAKAMCLEYPADLLSNIFSLICRQVRQADSIIFIDACFDREVGN